MGDIFLGVYLITQKYPQLIDYQTSFPGKGDIQP